MLPEVVPARRPLPPEEISPPPKESLPSRFLRVLERTPATTDTYNLREAAQFLNQAAKGAEIEASISRTSLQKWTAITLAGIIKEVDRFPSEETLPLSPTALFFLSGARYKCSLSRDDLQGILSYAQEAYKGGLEQEYASAREIIRQFRDKCYSPQEIAIILKGKSVSRHPYRDFIKKLDRLILDKALPLNNYPRILARAVGIPREFFERELKEKWRKTFLLFERRRKEELHPRFALRYYPEEFISLRKSLGSLLEVWGIKLYVKYIPLLAIYLKERGIKIKSLPHKTTGYTYHILSSKEQAKIKRLLENEETREEVERIARNGLTLEEYTQTYRHHFPDGTPIALTEAVRLSGGPKYFFFKKGIERVKEMLRQKGITLIEKPLIWREPKSVVTYLPIEQLAGAVEILKEAISVDPTISRSIRTLYQEGKAFSLTPILRQALPGIKIPSGHLLLLYKQHLADIDDIHRIRAGGRRFSYFVLKTKRQEVIKAIRERREEIIQTLEGIKKARV